MAFLPGVDEFVRGIEQIVTNNVALYTSSKCKSFPSLEQVWHLAIKTTYSKLTVDILYIERCSRDCRLS